jgi:hypothetical protein
LVPSAATGSLGLVVLGWGFVAGGLSTADALSEFLPSAPADTAYGLVLNTALGMSAALFCGVVHRAVRAFEG